MCCSTDILLALLAVLFPPIAVWIKSGLCTIDSLLNILLCVLGYIPGLLHAWYIIAKYPSPDTYYDSPYANDIENQQGHVTYYYVSDSRNNSTAGLVPGQGQQQQYPSQRYDNGGSRGYGTVQGMRAQPQPQPQPQQNSQQVRNQQQQGQSQQQRQVGAGEGSSQGQQQQGGVPPSYEQAIAGDNKVQT
ncbi:MAG: hypothetical protein Q9222_000966 [Ikaeria aurantiellina]